MGISHDIGLFFPFKVNRPLTAEEKKRRFVQGRRRRCPGEAAVLDFETVIRINTTYLEVIDKFHSTRGMITAFIMGFCLMIVVFISAIAKVAIFDGGSISFFFFLFIFCSVCMCYLLRILCKEWFRYTHYPVRFNRKTRQVHIFQVSGEIITVPWNKIYFTTNRQRFSECIVGHILAEDNDTVLNTFSFGHVGTRDELSRYWEFIRCYMEEDCVVELAATVLYCPPVEYGREGYITGLQMLLQVESRLEWLPTLLLLPLSLVESVSRYIGMQTSRRPQWSAEVEMACRPEPGDPVNVGAEHNGPGRWRTVLANEPRAVYDAKNQYLKDANQKIRDKMAHNRAMNVTMSGTTGDSNTWG